MIELRHDLREQARLFFEGSTAIYTVAGDAIAKGIWVEFEQLVRETAQWTGSTAASWNLDKTFGRSTGQTVSMLPRKNPLIAGHSAAVNVALDRNRGRLDGLGETILRSGINVWNESITAEMVESGENPAKANWELRERNKISIGAFRRFKERVRGKVFEPLAGHYTMEELVQKARAIRQGQ